MGKPAAKTGCYHTCPDHDGDHPHVGGPVLEGSTNVFFNKMGACRIGDTLQCQSSHLDRVQTGSATVFANGKPIARLHDSTEHDGVLAEGSANISID